MRRVDASRLHVSQREYLLNWSVQKGARFMGPPLWLERTV